MNPPKIEGITWVDKDIPEIISVPISLEDKKLAQMKVELGLDNIDISFIKVEQFIDLSKLAGLRHYYSKSHEEHNPNECLVDVEGMFDFVADIPRDNLLEAWIYYKRWKYSFANDPFCEQVKKLKNDKTIGPRKR